MDGNDCIHALHGVLPRHLRLGLQILHLCGGYLPVPPIKGFAVLHANMALAAKQRGKVVIAMAQLLGLEAGLGALHVDSTPIDSYFTFWTLIFSPLSRTAFQSPMSAANIAAAVFESA